MPKERELPTSIEQQATLIQESSEVPFYSPRTQLLKALNGCCQKGETPKDVLNRLYWQEKRSGKQISALLGVGSADQILGLMEDFDIPKRSRVEATILINQDPEFQRFRAQRIHTEESDRARSQAMKRYYQTHPEWKSELSVRVKAGFESRKQSILAGLQEKYGDQLIEVLERKLMKEGPDSVVDVGLPRQPKIQTVLKWIDGRERKFGSPRKVPKTVVNLVNRSEERGYLDFLSAREKMILEKRTLSRGKVPTFRELARELHVSRTLIQAIERTAMIKLEVVFGDYRRAYRLSASNLKKFKEIGTQNRS